jgi:hypothetical protein
MENNKYREAMARVTTPTELKEKTRRMLAAETTNRKSIWKPVGYIALAAAFVLVAGIGLWMLTEPGSIAPGDVTPGDIELNFVLVDDDPPPFRMAHQYPLRRAISLDDLPGVIPEDTPDGFMLIDETITEFFSAPSDTPDAVLGELTYQTQNGAPLTVIFTDMPIYLPIEISGSYIYDTQVGLGHTEADEKLYAAFEKHGFTYLLTAEGINRDEFTQILIHFIAGF